MHPDPDTLARKIKSWGMELGFQQLGIADVHLDEAEGRLQAWLGENYHGEMGYMSRHGTRRSRPAELVPDTIRVISARMDYLPGEETPPAAILDNPNHAYIARYALGRDYHKTLRQRLQQLADQIESAVGPSGYRVFVDSAPVMEKPLAQKAGLGWIGKHTNIINKQAGSWFVLGEIYTDLPLPADKPADDHCGTCRACIDVCPTDAIVAPYVVDARRCISYLTIELKNSIPTEFRTAIGNRIFGCDDCQLFCPWNKFAAFSGESDFSPRHGLDTADLVTLFAWNENEWSTKTVGSAIRRAGYVGWLRNIAVALGNAPYSDRIVNALRTRADHVSGIVREHVQWALEQHESRARPVSTKPERSI
jgi:epoxyqueuosine reductase